VGRYDWLLFLHVLAAFLFVSGGVLAGILQFAAMRRERPSEIATLLSLLQRFAVPIIGVGSLATLVLGIWLAEDVTPYGVGEGWVIASIVLWAVAAVAGGLGGREPRRARELATRLAAEGDGPSAELARLVRDRNAAVLNYGSGLVLIAILVLMIFKPGAA
jgi:uncharacterized membrane protein